MPSYTTVPVTPGVGAGIAVDVVGGADFQRVKVSWGVEGAAVDISATNPLPSVQTPISTDLTEVAINAASNGNNTIIAAGGAGNKIRVYQFFLRVNGAAGVSLKFQDGAGGTDFFPVLPFNDKDGWVMGFTGRPWFTGTANTLLNLNLSAAIQVSGRIYYTLGT